MPSEHWRRRPGARAEGGEVPRSLLRAWRLALALPVATAAAQDPCLAFEDIAERIACYAAEDSSIRDAADGEETPGWRVGEDTDPITDETSVILRRHAAVPHRDVNRALALPTLTIICYRGREVLLSLEAFEPIAEGDGAAPAETRVTYRIGSDAPVERDWTSSPPHYRDAYLDRHGGSVILARALAEDDSGELRFRYRTVPDGGLRTVRFGLDGLATLLPRLEQACGAR